MAFAGLPSTTTGQANARNIYFDKPNIYCGQVATFHVFMPTGSEAVTFQAFTQYNGYAKFGAAGPTTITRNGWTTYAYTIPSDVGPGGIQRIGVQFIHNPPPAADGGVADGGTADGGTADGGTAALTYTGDVYVDQITW